MGYVIGHRGRSPKLKIAQEKLLHGKRISGEMAKRRLSLPETERWSWHFKEGPQSINIK